MSTDDYDYDGPEDDDDIEETEPERQTVSDYFGDPDAEEAVKETVKNIMAAAGYPVPEAKAEDTMPNRDDVNDQILDAILDGRTDDAEALSKGQQPMNPMNIEGVVGMIPDASKRIGVTDPIAKRTAAEARYEAAAAKAKGIEDVQDRVLAALHDGNKDEAARIGREAYNEAQRASRGY